MTGRLAVLVSLLVSGLIAGCGSSSSSSPAPASAAAAVTLRLSETEFKISPATPTVSATGPITIVVKNTGAITHALAVQTPSGVVKTGSIASGSTATVKVDASKDGRYTFFCPIGHHRAAGMQGVLLVGSAGGGATGTTTSNKPAMGY